MAKMQMRGLEEYIRKLELMRGDSEEELKRTVYKGADVVADTIKEALLTIPTHPPNQRGTPEEPLIGLTAKEKGDLINSFGLAPIRRDGDYINTKAGFDGYGSTPTKKYPNGVPNSVLMRSLESGTSFRQKFPVIRQATQRARAKALEAMQQELETQISNLMEE